MIQEGLTFISDEDTHAYFWHGCPVPSVTTILSGVGVIDSRWFNEQSAIRGTYVHEATALFDRNELREDTLDPVLVPYVDAYKKFLSDTLFAPTLIEEALYSEAYGFAGTLDRTGDLYGNNVLIDIKTGTAPKWVKWQTAAYRELTLEVGTQFPQYRHSLQLKEDGTYRLSEPMIDPHDWQEFLAMLTVYNCKKSIGVKE